MLTIKNIPVYMATTSIDFRKSIDGLCALICSFQADPQKGLYIFFNKNRNKLKLLFWHRNGFVLTYKRLEKGQFFTRIAADEKTITINEQQMQWLAAGLDWQLMSSFEPLSFEHYF